MSSQETTAVRDQTVPDSDQTLSTRRKIRAAVLSSRADSAGLVIGIAGLCLFFSIRSPYFFTGLNFSAIGVAISVYVVASSAQTFVIVSGNLDLSITATWAMAGLVTEAVLNAGMPLSVQILAGLSVGVGVGLLNALLVVYIGVNAFIATIGTQFLVRGAAYVWTQGVFPNYFIGKPLNWIGTGKIATIPVPIIWMTIFFIAAAVTMKFTRFGSRTYALGGSANALRLAGVNVRRMRTFVYILSGLAAAAAGILSAGMDGTSSAQNATGEELVIIGAVIIGGTSLSGGRGTPWGTLLGVALLGILQNGLNLLGVQAYWQMFVQGAVLVIAVTADELRRRAREKG